MVVSKPVNRCVCANVTFEAVKEAGVTSLEQAIEQFQMGLRCRACRPYIRLVIETGETAFAVLDHLYED